MSRNRIMKFSLLFLLKLINCIIVTVGESNANELLSAEESDPIKLGWMQGFPPPNEKRISATKGNLFQFPAIRYSVCHMREFFPTTNVASATKNQYNFEDTALDPLIDMIEFKPSNSNNRMTFKESLEINYTDGLIILHKGKIRYEKYFGALTEEGVHAVMSVSKTLTGTLGALLIEEGLLDENEIASAYVPELANSAFGDATIREILDMTTALQYSEDYSDPSAEVYEFSEAGNPFLSHSSDNKPKNYFEYLETVQKQGEHGDVFAYKTINTDVMGWILSRVTGMSLEKLLSERIWKPLGTNIDGYYQIDGSGIAFAGGGFSGNLRDMAMFGEMIRNEGFFNNQQVLPESLIKDIFNGGSQEAFANSTYASSLKNWSYRNMWWITHNEHGAVTARGVYGQTIYIDPSAEMVLVRFASHPYPKNAYIDPTSLPAYHAVAKYLKQKQILH